MVDDGHGAGVTGGRRRVALAHDWLSTFRGGEAVLERIAASLSARHEVFGVYSMFRGRHGLPVDKAPTVARLPATVPTLGRLPLARDRFRRWLLPMYPRMVEKLSARLGRLHEIAPIDALVSTRSAAVKGMRAPSGAVHVCYCHAPARYLWSRASEYEGGLRGRGLSVFGERLRAWDKESAANVDVFVANSRHIARQIEETYGRSAEVVHPPARTAYFTPGDEPRVEFWLAVGALEPYKRFDLAIDAAREAGAELKIVGEGSCGRELRKAVQRGDRVEFLGRVGDERLRELYRTARLLIFPQIEDFGIVAVEAQACGCPVLARAAGGALDSVLNGKTGVLVDEESARAFAEGARRMPSDARTCVRHAARFSEAAFDGAMIDVVERALAARKH